MKEDYENEGQNIQNDRNTRQILLLLDQTCVFVEGDNSEVHIHMLVDVKEQDQELEQEGKHQVECTITADHRKLEVKHEL